MFRNDKMMVLALLGYCAIGIPLFFLLPWLDLARYGRIWLVNLAILPVLPAALLLAARGWRLREAFLRRQREHFYGPSLAVSRRHGAGARLFPRTDGRFSAYRRLSSVPGQSLAGEQHA